MLDIFFLVVCSAAVVCSKSTIVCEKINLCRKIMKGKIAPHRDERIDLVVIMSRM